jgi:RHH-type proline utilization regulon transcriptional repressor/proline dehydrogenase/delta 1-pyrroline-5-carboxylate dehydrogenase
MRIVKGANLAAERVECSLRGWPLPIYDDKLSVDANYKCMLDYATEPEHARAVQLGVASHNLFDVAFALVLRAQRGLSREVAFELLEGMADPLRRTLQTIADEVLVYCPIVEPGSIQTAIAYLTRRLDENTAPENFLRNAFGMRVGDPAWQRERERFSAALALRRTLSHAPRRIQDRSQEAPRPAAVSGDEFRNEPDTDFALPNNRAFITRKLAALRATEPFEIAMQIAGERASRSPLAAGFDPSRPNVVPYRHPLASAAEIERALDHAAAAADGCRRRPVEQRIAWLRAIATGLRESRGELIAAMLLDAGKRIEQADAEVSEAIDFAEYYARVFDEHARATEFAAMELPARDPRIRDIRRARRRQQRDLEAGARDAARRRTARRDLFSRRRSRRCAATRVLPRRCRIAADPRPARRECRVDRRDFDRAQVL